ncbi:conserved exported hypothetical protein [Vibrio nigripulchritudo SO65]|uniref:zinc-dependent metalloprotease n=1 Tax=Vibrio nigripulchritudo TaxID=28173 RepID=UPI0003B20F2A|nr:zinc-dependent metalloprotease [Vibrio nigripulchritudo]CCN34964.1 conserved exported hypothetical protein [Vibrio nigripulchritudo AM115]CCN43872.1 conserved exported hypothetical protein [Vibrio nigripulchritudo FTn2]CCN67440.1 conserved exported hypothetical protein [Vibrio nigripulchritudo POn4]CCN79256.1 conserved exported hypothetical protein [Vibrio nigripulchritudo SO65]
MNFKKLSLVTAVGAALVGCGADDQAYEYVDRETRETALSSITTNTPTKVDPTCQSNCQYEIPLDGVWMFQQTFGDVTRTSDVHPYMYDFLNEEKLVTLKFTESGLVAEVLEGDITFEGETSRFEGEHNEPVLVTLGGSYEAYQCKEDSYGDCTNKEEKVSDPSVKWWQKTHFTPDFEGLDVHDDQTLFKIYFDNLKKKAVSHVEFAPNDGVINIEHEHDIVSRGFTGEPEKNTVFYSLVRLDTIASKGYQPIHYDMSEHDKFGFFKTDFEKLNPNHIGNQHGYKGHFINRFNPEKEKIEYYLSDEFFRKDTNGNFVNQQWLDATIRGFDIINKSLEDNFSANGRIVPKLELVNANSTEPSGVRVGDLRKNVIHIVPEASDGGGGGLGPSYANPLTGEILSAYTIMFPGNLIPGTSRQWDTLARHYNEGILNNQLEDSTSNSAQAGSSYASTSLNGNLESDSFAVGQQSELLNEANESIRDLELAYDQDAFPELNLDELRSEKDMKLAKMIENNIYPVDQYSVSTSIKKTNVTDLDFIEQGFYFEQTQEEVDAGLPKRLKSWENLSLLQREIVTTQISTHYYLHVLTHEIGHNLGLRHNFAGSYDGHNFYSAQESVSLGLNGLSATSSVMDYMPSSLNSQPAFGLYDRAALRFAYQRKVESHDIIDEESMSDEQVASTVREYRAKNGITMIDLSSLDEAKRADHTKDSALASVLNSGELAKAGKELREYAYCTDGRGRAELESGCLIFDEGSSLTQISEYYSEQYIDRFESNSTRKERVEFNENIRSVNKFFSTHRMFSRMNMVVDDYYQEFRNNPKKPDEVCPAADDSSFRNSEQQESCDVANAAYQQAFFYLDLLKSPVKTCNLNLVQTEYVDGNAKEPEEIPNYKMDLWLVNIYGGLIAGDEYTKQLHVPTSCFDDKLTNALSQGSFSFTGSNGNPYTLALTVTAESKYGEFLNKIQLAGRASTDNAPRIGYEVEHLGNWMDKVLALEYLLTPSSLRGIDFALVDLPGVREELNILIDHWNLGSPIPLPSDDTSITSKFSNVINPYEMVDKDGKTLAVSWTTNWKTKDISSTPSYLSWWFANRYGLHRSGGTPLPKVMNQVLTRFDSLRTDTYKPEAYAMRSKLAVYDYNGHVPAGFEGIEILGRTYAVDIREDSIALAKPMLESIKTADVIKFGQYTNASLVDFSLRKTGIIDAAVGTSTRGNDLKASTQVKTLQDFGLGVDKFAAAMLANVNNTNPKLTVGELNAAIDALVASGDATNNGTCITLPDLGCLRNNAGLFYQTSIDVGVAFKSIWISDAALADETVQYLTRYTAELSKLVDDYAPLLSTSLDTLDEYLKSPLERESMRLEAIDNVGFRNLVIVDEHDRVSSF